MPAITARNLTKRYGSVTAVDGVDMTVEEGTIHGFVGPNGAGKSTTMQMLVGTVSPTTGEATINGKPAGTLGAVEELGYAPQEPVFYESMTARSYLRYIGTLAGLKTERDERVQSLLAQLALTDAADEPIGGYSGGMQRRLGLAQALLHDPAVLILDEPTAELDPQGRATIIETLEELTTAGVTVFVSSHILAELEQFIEAVTIIADGQVVTSGPLDEIRSESGERYQVRSTDDDRLSEYLAAADSVERVRHEEDGLAVRTTDPEAFVHALPTAAAEGGVGLRSLRRQDGLEDAFLDIVTEASADRQVPAPASSETQAQGQGSE